MTANDSKTTSDARSTKYAENDEEMFAQGTDLTLDRAASLDKVGHNERLSYDDHANLTGLARDIRAALSEKSNNYTPNDPKNDALIEQLQGIQTDHQHCRRDMDGHEARTWSAVLEKLIEKHEAYDTTEVRQLSGQLAEQGTDDITGAISERFTSVTDDAVTTMQDRGYNERDIKAVMDVLNADVHDIGLGRDYTSDIPRAEQRITDGVYSKSSNHHMAAIGYMSQYQVTRETDPELAEQSFAKVEEHLAQIDPKRLGILELEQLVHKIAGDPDTQHMGDKIVSLASEAASQLNGSANEYEKKLATDPTNSLTHTTSGDPGPTSIGTHYVERGLEMSGIAAAYGATATQEEPLLDRRATGITEEWNQKTADAIAEDKRK